MSLFDSLGSQSQPQGDMRRSLAQLQADPSGFLGRAGYTIPAGMKDPGQIMNHLLQTGQVQNGRLRMLQQLMGRR